MLFTSAQSSTFKWLSIVVLFTPRAIVPFVVTGEPLSISNQSDQEIATLVTVPEPHQVSHTGIAGTI